MKKILYSLFIFIFFLMACSAPMQTTVTVREQVPAPPPTNVVVAGPTEATYQVFYDELAPYGRWINYPDYGYVWIPTVGGSFQPYSTNGHWVYSNSGWAWVSNYQWGWAVFHYGRWLFEDGYGWLWIPGHEWAPAWVTWGNSGGYYGWAPLGPRINIGDNWNPPVHSWTFVPREHMNKPNVESYVIDRNTNVTIVKNITIINNHNTTIVNNNVINNNITNNTIRNNTTVINNNQQVNKPVYNMGPHVNEVEKASNTHIEQVNITEHAKPATSTVSNNNLYMYRPTIMHEAKQQQLPSNNKPLPKNVEQYKKRQ